MALDTNDIFPVQKAGGGAGSVRQATIGALLNLATTTAGYWERSGTELSPVNDGDDLTGIGDISAGAATFSDALEGTTGTFSGALEAESIDGGFQDLGSGEVDYPA